MPLSGKPICPLAILFALLLTPIASAGTVGESASLKKDFAAAARNLDLQTSMPKPAFQGNAGNRNSLDHAPLVSTSTAQTMLWCAFIALLLIMALVLLDKLPAMRDRSFAAPDQSDATVPEAVEARMESAKGEADALARDGNYAEAIHVLLLQSLREMRLKLHLPIALSLTSREILRSIRLDPQAHDALADIIGQVEISYFGDHGAELEDYMACRERYAALMSVLRQGGAA